LTFQNPLHSPIQQYDTSSYDVFFSKPFAQCTRTLAVFLTAIWIFSFQVYDITHLVSSVYYKSYASLTKAQKLEWNNRWSHLSKKVHPVFIYMSTHRTSFTGSRGISTVHAIFITYMSVYLVFFSHLFSDQLDGPITSRSSSLSNFTLGVKDLTILFPFECLC
jgi:hypothetical protein